MNTTNKIKVAIVDDSALIRSVMTEIVNSQPDMEVVGVAPDPLVARDLIKRTTPTCSRSTSRCRRWTASTSSKS
jgi:two-component system chemotaxis response regulator CheB